jgi:hypothetical protein
VLQARADGGDEMDDLLSAPRMVLLQFVDKWFPDADSETTAFPTSRLQKLLLDVSTALVPDDACLVSLLQRCSDNSMQRTLCRLHAVAHRGRGVAKCEHGGNAVVNATA